VAAAIAIVGDHLRHRWYAGRVAADAGVELLGIVSERQRAAPAGASAEDDVLIADHFAERRAAEERFFGDAPRFEEVGVPVLEVGTGQASSPVVVEFVRGLDADTLLLYGCGIVREPVLDRFERAINMHLGLSPYYRGHATNFWPLVNGEPECVGTTVHLATLDVDAGAILRQARPDMSAEDGNHDIGCKAIVAGVDALLGSLDAEPVPQQSGGRVYTHRDFGADAVRELRRRFAEGMIPCYLAEKAHRDARFPIVE
jgi:folate-dependent phosphoribosylglycinamide formyltransferase PurN